MSDESLMKPLSAFETNEIHNGAETPVRSHADVYGHQTQRWEEPVQQIGESDPESEHGRNRKCYRVVNISGGPERAYGNKGEGIQSNDGEQRADACIVGAGL